MLGIIAVVPMAWANAPNKLALVCTVIFMIVQTVVVHMLINYYYNTYDGTEKMLGVTGKYYDYGYKKNFIELVENFLSGIIWGRRPSSGILRCRLKNGKNVELYAATGAPGINYMIEQLTKYKFNFHMN